MANTTITNLPTVVALNGTEPLLGVQSGSSVQITTGQIAGLANGTGGAPFAVPAGGTGQSSFTQYGLIYGDGIAPLGQVPAGFSGEVLVGNTGGAPTWSSSIPSTAAVTSISFGTTGLTPNSATTGTVTVAGTLNITNGGTGATTLTTNGILYGNATSAIGATPAGTTGQILIGNTGSAPSWAAATSIAVTSISFGTTGLTPSTATQGAVTVAGTLAVANGGTGATSPNAALTNLQTFTETATAAGTTTLTNTSTYFQFFTGTSTQTIVLPVTSTLAQGWSFHIVNNSTGNLTVNSSGGNLVITVIPGTTVMVTCILTSGTTAASWEAGYTDFATLTGTGNVVLATSPTIATPTITTSATVPLVIGGTGAASSLTLQSTSGVGTTDSILFKTGNNGAVTALTIASNGNATFLSTSTTAIGTLSLTNDLTVPNGGTGVSTFTSNGVLYGNAAGNILVTAQGGANTILVANAGAPSFSATPTINTSVTVPLVIGGTAAGSTLTLQSTSGVGTTDSVIVKTGNNGAVTAATFNTTGVATSRNWYNTATQTATNTATLTAAQITGPFLLGTPTATASYTLPLASDVETALGTPPNETGWEFVVFTTAAFAITLLTNTGWTLVGSMATGATANSFARFRARKTALNTFTLYRIS